MGISSQKPAPTPVVPAPAEIGEAENLEPGSLVSNRYRVLNLLGEGAMGAVYRVEHVHIRKTFALKVLHGNRSSSPEIVARFEREAVAAGNINHRNVAAATDFGKLADGSFFLVLEFVAGRSLRAELEGGRLEPRRAIRIMQGIVAGVAAAHDKGIVHRDLKPENIMLVDRDGNPDFVKVLDFGIAKVDAFGFAVRESGMQPLTQVGTVMGTPVYMSPEQAVAQEVDARSDLYTLGIILFELLTGDCPFRGGMITVLRRHLMDQPPPLPPGILEQWDPRMAEIVRKLLEKDPEKRFQTAAELTAALDEVAVALERKTVAGQPRTTGPLREARGPSVFFNERVLPRVRWCVPKSMVQHVTARRAAIGLCLFFGSIVAASMLFCGTSERPTDARSLSRESPAASSPAPGGRAREPSRSSTPAPKSVSQKPGR